MSDDRRNALVCSDDERLLAQVEAAGFVAVRAATRDDALPRVQHDAWTIVVIDATTDPETLRHLNRLPGVRRRELFVIKVGEPFATGDRFQAWAESVDLVVQMDDTENLALLVEEWMTDKDSFYSRFRNIQREPGTRLGAHA